MEEEAGDDEYRDADNKPWSPVGVEAVLLKDKATGEMIRFDLDRSEDSGNRRFVSAQGWMKNMSPGSTWMRYLPGLLILAPAAIRSFQVQPLLGTGTPASWNILVLTHAQ